MEIGDSVRHTQRPSWGTGVIVAMRPDLTADVDFSAEGLKSIARSHWHMLERVVPPFPADARGGFDGYRELPRPMLDGIQKLIALGRKADAIKLLDKVIQHDGGLFREQPETLQQRRIALMLKVALFREWEQPADALAWTCLECEINPDNVSAQAMKEQLKRQLHLSPTTTGTTHVTGSLSWEGVAGMRELKVVLERDVVLPLREREIYERYRVSLPNGILLYGPPGCGKTFIVRALAKHIDYSFLEVRPSDLASIYVHGTQEKIGELFKSAREKAPCVLFFDEIDALVPNREHATSHHYSAEVNEFLVQLDNAASHGLLVVGATNIVSKIDPAVRRPGRFDKKILVGPPDFDARVETFKEYMRDRPQAQIDWIALASLSDRYTFAEIRNVVDEAARSAIPGRERITTDHVKTSLRKNPPQLTAEEYEEYGDTRD